MILVPADVWKTHFCLDSVLEISMVAETVITSKCVKLALVILLPVHSLYFEDSRGSSGKIDRKTHPDEESTFTNFITELHGLNVIS